MLVLKYLNLFRFVVLIVLVFTSVEASAQKPCYTYPDAIDNLSIQKANIRRSDSVLFVAGNIRADYRVIGYANPDTCSRRVILFSVFTRDVKGNPYGCEYGAYYATQRVDSVLIRYTGTVKGFVQASVIVKGVKKASVYFERRWIQFAKN